MRIKFEKSNILLICIVAIFCVLGSFFYFSLRSDSIKDAVKSDRIIKVLFVLTDKNKPIAQEALFYYPVTHRSAIIDIPNETALIIKALERYDRIDTLFDSNNTKPYVDEIQKLLATDLPYTVVMNLEEFSNMVDLVDGLDVFIPNEVSVLTDTSTVLLPSGALVLDGYKMKSYVSYIDPQEPEIEHITRKQRSFLALLKKLGDKAEYLQNENVFNVFKSSMHTNMDTGALSSFIRELGSIDVDKIVPQRISGTKRDIEGRILLFPLYDGDFIKDVVRQTLNAIANNQVQEQDMRVFTVELLNGTLTKGLAKKTSDLFMSFGYDVLGVDNVLSDNETDKTVIYDRFNNPEAAANLAQVIRCKNIVSGTFGSGTESNVDFTVILGKDFNGRFCIQ